MAGGLKQQLTEKYGIHPKMRHQYHELEVLVNGRSVFCYSTAERIPTAESLLATVEDALRAEAAPRA